jgi:GTP 3',8-cyclase
MQRLYDHTQDLKGSGNLKRVFILAGHSLFGRCIESLLRHEEGVEIVGNVKDLDRAIERIRILQPDVVIVDSNDSDATRAGVLLRLMKEEIKAHVVGINLRDNTVMIWHGEQRVIKELGDFLDSVMAPGRDDPAYSAVSQPEAATLDSYGRTLDYLRVSITDRCNLRCVYCMPSQGVPSKPREAILRSEEIVRMVQAAAHAGFRAIRLTGGEPLVRKGVVGLVRMVAEIPGIQEVALTTNATLLSTFAKDLAGAGLTRVNISLDSLKPERFRRITRQGNLESAWRGIAAAEAAGLTPLKINMVVVKGFNDDEVSDFARLTLDHPWHIRFIEVMPVEGASDWGGDLPGASERLITAAEIRARLEALGPLVPEAGPGGRGPASYYRLPNAQGTLGFISPMSDHFCASCNRLRLTADGHLRACLFSDEGVYCKPALEDGASLKDLEALIRQAAAMKPERHSLVDGEVSGAAMSAIGG